MKERLATLGLALLALFCFYVLFAPARKLEAPVSQPQSTDAGRDGYLLMRRWLEDQHIPVVSLRRRFNSLDDPGPLPETGNVMIITLPGQMGLGSGEADAVSRWAWNGNTLVVLAALDDTPGWTRHEGSPLEDLHDLTALDFTPAPRAATKATGQATEELRQWLAPREFTLLARGGHPLLEGVSRVEAVSELPADHWNTRVPRDEPALPLGLLRREDSGQGVFWVMAHGRGQMIVSTFATPFNNQMLTRADNARLLSNLVAWTRSPEGSVIFDDAHQGLVDFYDPAHFFADPRLHRSLGWLLLLWLVFVLGPQRPRQQPDRWRAPAETALLEAGGRFYTLAVDPHDAARVMFRGFFDRLRRRIGLPENGEPPWEWLDERGALSAPEREELQARYARVCARERVSLPKLHNFLLTLEGRLT